MSPVNDVKMPVIMLKRIKIIACKKCTKVFTKPSDYEVHKLKHDLQDIREERINKNRYFYGTKKPGYDKTLQCDQCNMRFVASSTLDAHLALHRPFPHVCDCGVGFYKSSDLQHHLKIVHNYKEIQVNVQKKKPKQGMKRKQK